MQSAAMIVECKRAVIFDLFHTLTALDSVGGRTRPTTSQFLGVSREAWNHQLLENSWDRLVGRKRDAFAIVAEMARAIDPSIPDSRIRAVVANRIEQFADALLNVSKEVCQVLETLRQRGKILGLISNADVMEVAAWKRSPLAALLGTAVFSCEVGCAKPGKEIYQICLGRLGIRPEESVFVGDGGSNELQGAREVGMATIMVTGIVRRLWPETIERRRLQADAMIEELCELLEDGCGRDG